jgi:hypothetical protein
MTNPEIIGDWAWTGGEPGRELAPRGDVEFLVGVCQVGFDGADADDEGVGDLLVADALDGQGGDAAFGRGQGVASAAQDPALIGAGGGELGAGPGGEGSRAALSGVPEGRP